MIENRISRATEFTSAHGSPLKRTMPRILIGDDEQTTSEMAATSHACYRIVSVRDGREAFRVLRQDSDFQAAIFNMTMPLLPGVDIVRYMKSEKRLMRIPVIIVSGDRGFTTVADSFAAGALAFLAKPFAAEQLHRAIRLAIGSAASDDFARAA